jgi:hypothetical protein
MTKIQVIRELLSCCADVLYERLGEGEYTEFLGGNVTFRLDLIRKPEKILANVNLPGKDEPKLKIEFKRPYTRVVERVNAVETAGN